MSMHNGDSIAPGVTNSPTYEIPTQSASDYGEYTKEALEGWHALAQLMANTPDFAAFPRFRDLNIKSLLYYQAELTKLREELHEIEWRDHREGELSGAPDPSKNVGYLLETKNDEDERDRMQYKKVAEIRMVLKEYSVFLRTFVTNKSLWLYR